MAPIVVSDAASRLDIIGNANGKICGHKIDLAVAGIAAAGASHPVARLKSGHAGARLQHKAGAGVAQRRERLQTRLHFLTGGRNAIRLRILEHLLHQVRTSHRFSKQRFPASLHRRLLRAGADRGKSRAHQNASLLKLGSRHIISSNLPGFHIFQQSAHSMPLHQGMELRRGMRVPLAAQQGVE